MRFLVRARPERDVDTVAYEFVVEARSEDEARAVARETVPDSWRLLDLRPMD